MRGLYGATSEDLRRELPELAESISAQLHELYIRPGAVSAEQVAVNLDAAKRAVARLGEALRREAID